MPRPYAANHERAPKGRGGLSEFAPETVALTAGRVMLRRIKSLALQRADFAFETTLASRTFRPLLRAMQLGGYEFHLVYL